MVRARKQLSEEAKEAIDPILKDRYRDAESLGDRFYEAGKEIARLKREDALPEDVVQDLRALGKEATDGGEDDDSGEVCVSLTWNETEIEVHTDENHFHLGQNPGADVDVDETEE